MGILRNGLNVNSYAQQVVVGFVILLTGDDGPDKKTVGDPLHE